MTAPGIRNRNPFNVRISSIPWQGKVPLDRNTDGAFEQFQTDFAGIRAGMRNSLTHQLRDGCATIEKLIAKQAPPNENDTEAYIVFVAKGCGVARDAPFNLRSVENMIAYSRACIRVECASQPYPQSLLLEAAKSALGI